MKDKNDLSKTLSTSLSSNCAVEPSLFEVLTPTITVWLLAGLRFNEQIDKTFNWVEERRDLRFIRLLTDALDWHDNQVKN